MNALPPNASPAACVQDAERPGPWRITACASVAARSGARPSAQGARRPGQPAYFTPAEMPNGAAGARVTGASGATGHGGRLACARVAQSNSPWKAARCANPCREVRGESEREQYAARRAAGECGRCGAPAPDGSARCERCARSAAKPSRKKAKNARGRRRYVRRRVRGLCIDCAAPAQGAARCPECARRSYLRSDEHRGLPILPPRYTVIEIATGADHGTWDSMAEVAMSLAYARLSREDVEVISDVSPMAALIGY